MDEETMRREVLTAFEYSYEHDDWVNPLSEALAGVSAEAALWRPGPGMKRIWDIVLHMAVWTENIIERMRSGQNASPAEGHWPPPPVAPDDAAWEAAQRRLWEALAALRAYMEAHSLDALAAGPYGLADLFCRFIHNAYHIGQITKMGEIWEAQRATA